MNLRQALKDVLDPIDLDAMVKSYDLVGDILIIELPQRLKNDELKIAERILEHVPRAKIIARKEGIHRGEYRTREMSVIAGEQRRETIHKEYGITLHLNPWEVYYSTRSSGERYRIACQVKPGEHVAVLGSGIAPFPLMIAKHSDAASIRGIEINPAAHLYGLKNVEINAAGNLIELYQGDAERVLSRSPHKFNRVISVLPTRHERLLLPALRVLRRGGTLHHYAMVRNNDIKPVLAAIEQASILSGHEPGDISCKKCGHCGSQTDRCCFTVSPKGVLNN